MRLLILLLSVAAAVAVPVAQEVSENYCHTCVDAIDNNGCNGTQLCDKEHPLCLTTVVFDEDQIGIDKRCARAQVCYNMEENNDDGCYSADDEFSGVCSYCCNTPGCNKELPTFDAQASVAHDEGYDEDEDDDSDDDAKPAVRALRKGPGSRPTSKPRSRPSSR
ncbi:ly6/PLAUR domain-containing protein 6, partial [Aplysia californica]|uniref:Ly6/PLAUR domain-containing protein 6 n=1 Tax=Aplysia californica TaxID=6500 RepID=A0ABM1A5U8_APLCA